MGLKIWGYGTTLARNRYPARTALIYHKYVDFFEIQIVTYISFFRIFLLFIHLVLFHSVCHQTVAETLGRIFIKMFHSNHVKDCWKYIYSRIRIVSLLDCLDCLWCVPLHAHHQPDPVPRVKVPGYHQSGEHSPSPPVLGIRSRIRELVWLDKIIRIRLRDHILPFWLHSFKVNLSILTLENGQTRSWLRYMHILCKKNLLNKSLLQLCFYVRIRSGSIYKI